MGDQRPHPQYRDVDRGGLAGGVDAAVVDLERLASTSFEDRRRGRDRRRPAELGPAHVPLLQDGGRRPVDGRVPGNEEQGAVVAGHIGLGGDRQLLGQAERRLQMVGEQHQRRVTLVVDGAFALGVVQPEAQGRLRDHAWASPTATSSSVRDRLWR